MTVRRLLLMALLASTSMWAVPEPATACSCTALPSGNALRLAGHHSEHLDVAFVGHVERIEQDAVVVRVDERLAGRVPDIARIEQSSPARTSCDFSFTTGARYLIEAHRNPNGTLSTSLCTFTQPYEALAAPEAAEDSAAEEEPAPSPGLLGLLLPLAAVVLVAAVVLALSRGGDDRH